MHGTATYRYDDTRGCIIQFCPPDDEHMCWKHVEAWNKLIIKFSASRWLVLRNKKVIYFVSLSCGILYVTLCNLWTCDFGYGGIWTCAVLNFGFTSSRIWFYRGADKSLARLGRKQDNVSVKMAWISFGALPCRKKELEGSSRLDVVEMTRVPDMLPSLFHSWSG